MPNAPSPNARVRASMSASAGRSPRGERFDHLDRRPADGSKRIHGEARLREVGCRVDEAVDDVDARHAGKPQGCNLLRRARACQHREPARGDPPADRRPRRREKRT
jgi:hypothetical protein